MASRPLSALTGRTAAWALAVLAVAPAAAAQQPERFTLSGRDVAVYNLAGEMRVVAGSGADVVVEVARKGADAPRLRVEAGDVRGREALRVLYPSDRIVYPRLSGSSRTTLSVRSDGTFGGSNGRSDRVTIRGSGPGLEAYADLTVRVPPGRALALYLGAGELSVSNVNGDLLVDVSAARVSVEGTRGSLRLDTGAGEVSVRDAQGDLDLDSGSGRVTLDNVRGRLLRVDSGSGAIYGADIAVSELVLDSGSGSVRLARVRAPDLRLDTGSGSIELDLLEDVNSLVLDSGSGGVTLRVPPTLGAEIEAETGSGGIDLGFPLEVRKWQRHYLLGRIGDGQGHIKIDSGSGEVRIVRS